MASKRKSKSVTELIRQALSKALVADEKVQIKRMYQALSKVEGIGQKGITDASTTINETLYGEHGAWKPRE